LRRGESDDDPECSAAEALHEVEKKSGAQNAIHAVTDVTGFSFLGHAREMALGNPSAGIAPVSFENRAHRILRI